MLQASEVINGADMRQWRKERGWNQGKVAIMLQSSQKTISNIEGKPYEPVPARLRQALLASENPAEARLLGQWHTTFMQALDHMQRHTMLPAIQNRTATTVAQALVKTMADTLLKEGVSLNFG